MTQIPFWMGFSLCFGFFFYGVLCHIRKQGLSDPNNNNNNNNNNDQSEDMVVQSPVNVTTGHAVRTATPGLPEDRHDYDNNNNNEDSLRLSLEDRIELYNKTFDSNGNQLALNDKHIVKEKQRKKKKLNEGEEEEKNTSDVELGYGEKSKSIGAGIISAVPTTKSLGIGEIESGRSRNSHVIEQIEGSDQPVTQSALEEAISAKDWDAVGAAAALLSSSTDTDEINQFEDGILPDGFSATGSNNLAEVADELEELIESGDWNGVVRATGRQSGELVSHNYSNGSTSNLCIDVKNEKKTVSGTCVICLVEYMKDDVIVLSEDLSCRHVYHKECMVNYLASSAQEKMERPLAVIDNLCPVCRRPDYCTVCDGDVAQKLSQKTARVARAEAVLSAAEAALYHR